MGRDFFAAPEEVSGNVAEAVALEGIRRRAKRLGPIDDDTACNARDRRVAVEHAGALTPASEVERHAAHFAPRFENSEVEVGDTPARDDVGIVAVDPRDDVSKRRRLVEIVADHPHVLGRGRRHRDGEERNLCAERLDVEREHPERSGRRGVDRAHRPRIDDVDPPLSLLDLAADAHRARDEPLHEPPVTRLHVRFEGEALSAPKPIGFEKERAACRELHRVDGATFASFGGRRLLAPTRRERRALLDEKDGLVASDDHARHAFGCHAPKGEARHPTIAVAPLAREQEHLDLVHAGLFARRPQRFRYRARQRSFSMPARVVFEAQAETTDVIRRGLRDSVERLVERCVHVHEPTLARCERERRHDAPDDGGLESRAADEHVDDFAVLHPDARELLHLLARSGFGRREIVRKDRQADERLADPVAMVGHLGAELSKIERLRRGEPAKRERATDVNRLIGHAFPRRSPQSKSTMETVNDHRAAWHG